MALNDLETSWYLYTVVFSFLPHFFAVIFYLLGEDLNTLSNHQFESQMNPPTPLDSI
jgi:hypothetical protein